MARRRRAHDKRRMRAKTHCWAKVRCVWCGSEKTVCTHTDRPIRMHRCKTCGRPFKSVEKVIVGEPMTS